ncbi:MAG: ATP-binding cassette domain-containing protein [Clostridia bacterium]|nr:ATP-binding cassette domain-containing protein [Clostridia bacterium]
MVKLDDSIVLEFRNVGFIYPYDSVYTLDKLRFCVNIGEKVQLVLGRQGGKTTVARMICGLLKPSEGDILYRGEKLSDCPFPKRKIGVLLEGNTFSRGSVYSNIEYAVALRNRGKNIKAITKNAITENGLDEYANSKVKELSALLRIKVALARLSTRELDLLVMDDVCKENLEQAIQIELLVEDFVRKRKCALLMLT